ncbi:MAG: molecular chaperone HscC [Clostridiales Family XIII bacterium]|jgi:molecular chaperone HscC|nr:molecular chaperone HscC [Clostridiales Family XIII bacterium]
MASIGIDLGTTNSLIAYITEDGPKIIPNSFGENLTPSVVSIDEEGQILTGKIAQELMVTNPQNTVSVFKRSMGTKREYPLGGRKFLPEELSAFIIKKLKEDAEVYLGELVEEAVISTPAYFNDAQRRATKTAGELAGLRVERIVSEPTSAAIAYGLHTKPEATQFLVFDLGGGTFDVSILEFTGNIMEVHAVAGDNFLGGEDFTEILMRLFLEKHGIPFASLCLQELSALHKSAETAKRQFASESMVTMTYKRNEELLTLDISRSLYEDACAPLLARLKAPIVRALSDASIKQSEIDTVVLVGGATKLPIVRTFVSKLFGRFPAIDVNPDEAVALGAAIQAGMKDRMDAIKELILTDVCPYTLGIETVIEMPGGVFQEGNFTPILERNTVIPASRIRRLYTAFDNQSAIEVCILQGESRKVEDNIFLGELIVPVTPAKSGEVSIDVRYTYDINGILEVEVTVVNTGEKLRTVIEKNPGLLTAEEIQERLEALSEIKIHPREQDRNKFLLEKGARLYQESLGRVRDEIGRALSVFDAVLEYQDPDEINRIAAQLEEFLRAFERNPFGFEE